METDSNGFVSDFLISLERTWNNGLTICPVHRVPHYAMRPLLAFCSWDAWLWSLQEKFRLWDNWSNAISLKREMESSSNYDFHTTSCNDLHPHSENKNEEGINPLWQKVKKYWSIAFCAGIQVHMPWSLQKYFVDKIAPPGAWLSRWCQQSQGSVATSARNVVSGWVVMGITFGAEKVGLIPAPNSHIFYL